MHVAVVMPCLNEEALLERTCASLGFGRTEVERPERSTLILVDNGSSDGTLDAMARIRANSSPGSVIIGTELERGYVPPRHRGTLIADELAARLGLRVDEVLIVQSDADTVYGEGYLFAMLDSANNAGRNFMLEGVAGWSKDFVAIHGEYIELCNAVDESVSDYFVAEADEVIVSDAMSAFSLRNYFLWGGHRREYDADGDEVFAETTRLFMRAKALHGTRRIVCAQATAYPSRRKIELDPVFHFATAGFPRGTHWRNYWQGIYSGPNRLSEFSAQAGGGRLGLPSFYRRAHSVVLFGLLPLLVSEATGLGLMGPRATKMLPREWSPVVRHENIVRPGKLIADALSIIEAQSSFLRVALQPGA